MPEGGREVLASKADNSVEKTKEEHTEESEPEDEESRLFRKAVGDHKRLLLWQRYDTALRVLLSDTEQCKLLHYAFEQEEIPTCCEKLKITGPTKTHEDEDEKQCLIETQNAVQDRIHKLKLELGLRPAEDVAGGPAKRSRK